MKHLDVYIAVDVENDEEYGVVTICPVPKQNNRYAYYFRTPDGEYTKLYSLESISVQEARDFEHTKLKDLVHDHLAIQDEDEWKFYRSRPTIWNDSSRLSPEVKNNDWLASKPTAFEDDVANGSDE